MNRILENELLRVELLEDRPVAVRYLHKPSGLVFGGGGPGTLGLDGERVPWSRWTTHVEREELAVRYRMALPERSFSLCLELRLAGGTLELRLLEWSEPGKGTCLSWLDLPLVTAADASMRFWRLTTSSPDPSAFGKMWAREQHAVVRDAEPEPEPRQVIHGALWNDRLCVFVDSSYPLFPTLHRITGNGGYAISLGGYRRRVRSREIPLLEAKVVFLEDTNGDGRADLSDYRLWLNRRLPDGDSLYARSIWYKFLMDSAITGVRTSFAQVEEIVRAIHNVTDGLPQIAYLVGCQEGGHDGAYPTLDTFNARLGTPGELRDLTERCRSSWNTCLSYHANLDDAYRSSRDWDEGIVVPAADQESYGVEGSICHTRDAESGRVFRRLEAMMEVFPVHGTLHFDNTRITNTLLRADPEGIGVLEELVCGLMPVMDWLRRRGITVTTEGFNGIPAEPTLLFSGFWHHDAPDGARQIYHRKIMGGGRGDHFAQNTVMDFGICNAIHHDFTYHPVSKEAMGEAWWAKHAAWMKRFGDVPLAVSFVEDFAKMVDWIYRGTLLYHFYLEREMLAWDNVGGGVRMRFSGGVVAEVCVESPESLRVTWDDVLIASGDDRFIPRDGAVYAYSRAGSERVWVLPPGLRERKLDVVTLTKDGRGHPAAHELQGGRILLLLEPGTPVKILPA